MLAKFPVLKSYLTFFMSTWSVTLIVKKNNKMYWKTIYIILLGMVYD